MMEKLSRRRHTMTSVGALSAALMSACALLGGPPEPPQWEAEAVVSAEIQPLAAAAEDIFSRLEIHFTGSARLDDGMRCQIYGRYRGLLGALVTVELAPAEAGTRVSAEVEKTEATEDEDLARRILAEIRSAVSAR